MESKLPSAEEILQKHISDNHRKKVTKTSKQVALDAIREAMTITRDTALEVAANEARTEYSHTEGYDHDIFKVDKESITDLKNHELLKIS